MDKEVDQDNIMRVHERFEKLKDLDNKHEKLVDEDFDDPKGDTDLEKAQDTSDMDDWQDEALIDMYRRFKFL